MAYLAQTLITRSWYLSGIVARNLQFVTGDQITDGLMLLNALLDFKQIETDLIPYWTYIEMPLVGGQEFYFLPNVADVESATFNIDVVRYPMDSTHRRAYFGSSRVDNIQTLPFNWNFNRGEGGGTLGVYFLPQANYPLKLMVKLFLNDVSLNTDLTNVFSSLTTGQVTGIAITNPGLGFTTVPKITISGGNGTGATASAMIANGSISGINIIDPGTGYTQVPTVTITGGGGTGATAIASVSNFTFLQTQNAGFDTSYIEYLRYALAEYMCSEYGILFNPESAKILKKMERKLMYISPPDLTMFKTSILTQGTGINWGDVNIGRGWRPD
jgi:hypothetical protein